MANWILQTDDPSAPCQLICVVSYILTGWIGVSVCCSGICRVILVKGVTFEWCQKCSIAIAVGVICLALSVCVYNSSPSYMTFYNACADPKLIKLKEETNVLENIGTGVSYFCASFYLMV